MVSACALRSKGACRLAVLFRVRQRVHDPYHGWVIFGLDQCFAIFEVAWPVSGYFDPIRRLFGSPSRYELS